MNKCVLIKAKYKNRYETEPGVKYNLQEEAEVLVSSVKSYHWYVTTRNWGKQK